jgi:hypothetical protein
MYWPERFGMWLAWRLPRRLAYWCAIRVIAWATTGPHGNTNPHDLNVVEALKRWNAAPAASRPLLREWWFRNGNVCATVGFYPMWRGFRLAIYENGGRQAHDCLDINIQVWRFTAWLTIFGIGRLAVLTRHIPDGPRGRGYTFGWLPGNE